MKKSILCLLITGCFCHCSSNKKTIDFLTLSPTELNTKLLALPKGSIPDSLKRAHDSCMGFYFDVNALLINTRDKFGIGSIVNRQSLQVINTLSDLGLNHTQMVSNFNVLTNPCYEKRTLHIPLKSLLGDTFNLRLPDVDEAINKEINSAISASGNAQMQTGSWVYLDIKDALQHILDTTKQAASLRYKENLLDTSNMVLTALESITEVSFLISTEKEISKPLQHILEKKPSVSRPGSQSVLYLFYIDDHTFQINISGFFPVLGQFMKAE